MRRKKMILGLLGASMLGQSTNAQLALVRQGRESVGEAEVGDFFGSAIVLGDFNGDGFDDLASGAPSEKNEPSDQQSGHVAVNFGSARGLGWEGAQSLDLLDAGLPVSGQARMGWALAAGDFDGNGCDDLAVGLPSVGVGNVSAAGGVLVFYGNPNGLAEAPQFIDQGNFSAAIETGDEFGWALGAGKLGSGDFDDLVIGSPGENGDRGAVFIIHGGPLGLSNTPKQTLVADDLGTNGRSGDRFGRAILIADVMDSVYDELLVGAPFAEDPEGAENTGRVYLAMGTQQGISTSDAKTREFDPGSLGYPETESARFGAALAAGDLKGNGSVLDFAVGAPGMEEGGRVLVAIGGINSLDWMAPLRAVDGGGETGDDFGLALAVGKTDGDGYDDLVVGQPGKSFQGPTQFAAGAVHVFRGSANGTDQGSGDRFLSSAFDGDSLKTLWFGKSVAIGRTSNSPVNSIVVGAPLADGGRGQVYDIAPGRQLFRPSCRSALAVNCAGEVTYALRPFEQLRIASTTKVMTLLLGCEATQRPQNDPLRVGLNESYAIEPWMYQAFPSTSNSSMFLFTPLPNNQPQETYTFNELLRILFPPSGNDVSYAIADKMFGDVNMWSGFDSTAPGFVDLMNQRAQTIGMIDTTFTNPAGVDAGEAFSTAYDMWLLSREAMENPLYAEISGSRDFLVNKIMPGDTPGQFQSVQVNASYQWLKTMQQLDPRIVGGKPGGTPGAGRTGVVYARPTENSGNLVHANGFGWASGANSRSQLAELIGMALDECSLSQEGPGGKIAPPVGHGPWFAGDKTLQGIQFSGFDGRGSDAGTSIELVSWAPDAPDGACLPVQWNHSGAWEIPAGGEVGVDLAGVRFSGGTLWNLGMGDSEPTENLRVGVLVGNASAGFEIQSLDRETGLLLPAIQKYTDPATVRIRNLGSETIFLGFSVTYDVEMKYDEDLFRASVLPVGQAVRASHTLREVESEGPGFTANVLIEDRIAGLRFRPTPVIRTHRFSNADVTGEGLQADLELDFLSAEGAPLGAFYDSLRIQGSTTMKRGDWSDLGRFKIDSRENYKVSQTLPPGLQLYLRVVGVEPDEID